MKKEIKILAIETSCDETCAAVISCTNSNNQETRDKQSPSSNIQIPKILSSVVSSSANLHAKTGGIVPEVASRAQMESILPVVELALQQANSKFKIQNLKLKNKDLLEGVTHIAVTNGPGLIGSLLVGFNAAKTIAYARNLPFIPINHIEGHIYSAIGRVNRIINNESGIMNGNHNSEFITHNSTQFPILALTVSGGHTSLTMMRDHGIYETIGETIDDAAGEAFDKVAKLLNLGYPGGPVVSKFAAARRLVIARSEATRQSKNTEIATPKGLAMTKLSFPRPLIDKPNFDFSFSGLKTAVLTRTIKHPVKTKKQKDEICFAFEEAVIDVLITKTLRAARKYKPKAVILAGGVAANSRLREVLSFNLKSLNLNLLMPPIELCGDNAVMIGLAAYYHITRGDKFDLFSTTVDSNLELK